MPRKALLLGRNGDNSLRWCCNYDCSAGDAHGLGHCDLRKLRDALRVCHYRDSDITVVEEECRSEGLILEVVKKAVLECAQEDDFLFYFSGHARPIGGQLELILAAGQRAEIFPSSRLIDLLQSECRAKSKLLILDCCYAEGVKEVWQPTPYDNLRILVSTKSLFRGKEVHGLKGGIFTHCLCEALTDPAHWRPDDPVPLVDAEGHIYSDKLLIWLKRRIAEVGRKYEPGIKFPEPIGFWNQGDPFLITQVVVPPLVTLHVSGWPPALLGRLSAHLHELGVGRDLAAASYTYCRDRADADILLKIPKIEGIDQVLKVLADPGRYYFAGNRLKLPLLTFVAHLSASLEEPRPLVLWIEDAQQWLVDTTEIDPVNIEEAALVVELPSRTESQPYLMIRVDPDLASAPSSFSVSWDYIDEYGDSVDCGGPTSGIGTQDALINRILASVRTALPNRAPCKAQVEVLLPFVLLSDDAFVDRLEQTLYRDGDRPPNGRLALGDLAAELPLVLRCWERWFESAAVYDRGGTDARVFWSERNACLAAAPMSPCLRWIKPRDGQPLTRAALLNLLPLPPTRPPLALACSDPISRSDLAALLDLGVPILLWPRHRAPTSAALKALKQSLVPSQLSPTLKTLPLALRDHRCREAALARPIPCDFSLLWEDPHRAIFDQPGYDTTPMG